MVERATIQSSTEDTEPTLEESAKALGIDVDEEASEAPKAPEKPEGVPEKFWDAEKGEVNTEALLKSYTELEKNRGKPDEDATETSPDEAEEIVTEAGLDYEALNAEYRDNGGLTDDSYKSLEDAGIPRELVDQYIQGQTALVENTTNAMYTEVGGKDSYEDMVTWAADTFDEGEIEIFNEAVTSGNRAKMVMAVKSLKARFDAEGFKEPTNALDGDGAPVQGQAYRSVAEVMKDMNDPRYKKDPAYRKDVEDKLARSDIM